MDSFLDINSASLSKIGFFTEYAVQDDIIPLSTKESWEFIRRYHTFYAYNPNSKTYTKLDHKDRVVNKYNIFDYHNVCVIFKDITYGSKATEDGNTTRCRDSLSYFLRKAILKNGLEICGSRMLYMD
jgi:hypothetical protein